MPKNKFGISCACLGVAIGGAMLIGIAVFLIFSGGNMGLELSGNFTEGGCYLSDFAFRDVSSATNADEIITKLSPKYKPSKEKIQLIIDESIKQNINPAILISFWGGEQTFGNPDKAFGYGKFNGKDKGFDNQLAGALGVINDAIENRGYYTRPEGENIWTRLLYNYVSAERKKSYDEFGYVSSSSENRIVILKLLAPAQVVCIEATKLACSENIFRIASSYIGKGIGYSQTSHCGPSQSGTRPVRALDCSGYVSRVYREAGLIPSGACWSTVDIVGEPASQYLTKIASDISQAQISAAQGDIIVWGNKASNGAFIHNDNSHTGIYLGNGYIYETTISGDKIAGPQKSKRAWTHHNAPFYGLYRAKNCPSTNE